MRNVRKQSNDVYFSEHHNDDLGRVKRRTFGQRLRAERDRLGFGQAEFAELGGVKRTTQHIYEHDIRVPDLNYLERIKASGADIAFLVLGERLPLNREDLLTVSYSTLSNIFRVVDEFCVDAHGKPLDLESRLRCFQLLCASLKDRPNRDADLESLRAQLRLFTGT